MTNNVKLEDEKKVEIKPTNPAASWEEQAPKAVEEVSKASALPQWDENARFGIRSSLENEFKVDGNRLGYDGKTVSLDGKPLIEAKNNVDGTTYTYGREDNVKALTDYGQKNGIVAVRDYLTSTGVPMDIEWNGDAGTVSINGYTIKPSYVIDGKAYVSQSVLDAIVGKTKKDTGIRTQGEILDDVNRKYGADEQAAYQAYVNREKFSYNPEDDAAYRAYMDTYTRAIEDEYQNNMAAARFRTGGVPSMGAMQKAAAIRSAAVEDIDATRHTFEDRAYTKWQDEGTRLRDEYALALGRKQNALAEEISASEADKNSWYYGKNFDSAQRNDEISRNQMLWNYENGVRNDELQYGLDARFLPEMYTYEADNAKITNSTNALNYDLYKKYAEGNAAISAKAGALGLEKTILQLKKNGYTDGQIQAIINQYF